MRSLFTRVFLQYQQSLFFFLLLPLKSYFSVLIDWIEFYALSVIFQPCNGGDYQLNVISFESLKFSWRLTRAYAESKSSETVFCVPRGLLSLTRGTIKRPMRRTSFFSKNWLKYHYVKLHFPTLWLIVHPQGISIHSVGSCSSCNVSLLPLGIVLYRWSKTDIKKDQDQSCVQKSDCYQQLSIEYKVKTIIL